MLFQKNGIVYERIHFVGYQEGCDEVLIDDSLGTNVVLFITGKGCLLEMADGEHAFYEFNRIYIKYVANK